MDRRSDERPAIGPVRDIELCDLPIWPGSKPRTRREEEADGPAGNSVLTGAAAVYLAFAFVLNDVFGRTILRGGKPTARGGGE